MARTVVWDDENIHHLEVERGERNITQSEVEEILLDEDSSVMPARAGRDMYVGRTSAGRFLAVIALGDRELRPETAWSITEERWRDAHA